MSLLVIVFLFLFQHENIYCGDVTDGTHIELAFMVHRHGDRSPTTDTIPYAKDPERIEEITKPYGYGQLTEKGLQTSYELGKFIRRRYGSLLSPKYNLSEIFIRSTDSTRAKMTTLAAMAAVYPPERKWNPELNWTPTPYTTIPKKYDYNLAELTCPTLRNAIEKLMFLDGPELAEYGDVYAKLSELGYKLAKQPRAIALFYDLLVSQSGIGVPLEPGIEPILHKIAEASGKVWDLLYGGEEHLALHSGVLLREFFEAADRVVAGVPSPRVRVQSGHDATLYPFLAATRARPRPAPLRFGALYSLELRKVAASGKYVVLPTFLGSPQEQEQYLEVEGCEDVLCDYEKIKEITSKYQLSEPEWRRLCNFEEDGPVDTSPVD